jgi:hypothetical protein
MSFGFINTNKVTLETFSGDVTPEDFINNVSKLSEVNSEDSVIHTDNNKVNYIDPVPYITSLKSLQEKLTSLMDECDQRREVFEKSVARREHDHFSKITQQAATATDLKSKFNDLFLTVDKLNTSKIDPLGEKLKKANTLKDNSTDIIFLMKCYNHFYINNEPPLELLTDRKNANAIETANILSQLVKLSTKLSEDDQLPNSKKVHKAILEFASSFENNQLTSFNTYYQSKNFARLQNITKTLFVYNDGVNIVDFFVNSHPIFVQMQGNVKQKVSDSYWKALSDPTNTNFVLDSASIELLEAARDTIRTEIDSITTIFQENSKQALISLISKLVEIIIKPRLKLLLLTANAQNKLCYLRTLHLFANNINQIVLSQLKSTLYDKEIDLSLEFDRVYTSLFNEYLTDNAYFKLEKENLESLIDLLINPFETTNKDALKDKKLTLKIEQAKSEVDNVNFFKHKEEATLKQDASNPFIDSMEANQSKLEKENLAHNSDLYLPDTRILRDKMKSAKNYVTNSRKFKKITGMTSFAKLNEKHSLFDRYKSSYGPTSSDINTQFKKAILERDATDENKPVLSLQVTQSIYKLILEALTRSIELMPYQINIYTIELFKLMLYKIGPSYIALGLELLYDQYVVSQKSKSVFSRGLNTDIDLSFLGQFYNIFIQLYLFSTVVKKSFYPLVSSEQDVNFISDSFNLFLEDVEIGVNIIMKDITDVIKERVDSILSKQPVNDYCGFTENDRTPTSEIMAMFIETVLRSASHALQFDSALKIKFISKVSNYFLSSLIIHLSHLKVTMNGFTVLTHDLAQYILVFNNLKATDTEKSDYYDAYEHVSTDETTQWEKEQLDQIQIAFKILNELPGLYTCQPESLKEFCSEGKLKDLKKSIIKDYVSNREDFQSWFLSNI